MDLNLLRPLTVLLEERHVSRAAARCDVSQPAMSRILERLRDAFGDELLVRSGRRYERTPRGEQLLADVGDVLDRLDATVAGERFDPQHCEARFRVATTDYASIVLLPHVLRDIESRAPNAVLDFTMWDDRALDDVAAGRIDAAIMSVGTIAETLRSAPLFDDEYACVVAADHPLRGRRLSLASYLRYRHAIVDVVRGSQPPVDLALAGHGAHRRVGYRTPFIGAAMFAVAQTSLILTIPRRLASSYAGLLGVRTVDAPRELVGFSYSLVWNKRLDASLAHTWFRERIRAVTQARVGGPPSRRTIAKPRRTMQ